MATRNAATTNEINSAYTLSANGDIINLTGTDYGVNGEWNSPTGTKAVTFQGAGATVTKFGMLNIRSSNSTWQDIAARTVTDYKFTDPAGGQGTGVTLRRVNVLMEYRTSTNGSGWLVPEPWPYGALTIDGAGSSGWELYDCIIGDTINSKGCQLTANDTLFDHCIFRNCFINNQNRTAEPDKVHLEGMQHVGCSGTTIRRCTFIRCNVMAIMFTNYGGSPPTTDITLENNLFCHSVEATNLANAMANDQWHVSNAVVIHYLDGGASFGQMTNWNVRYNTFETTVTIEDRPVVNSNWIGNVGAWDVPAASGMTYRYNVGTKVHSTDTLVSPAASVKGTPAPFGWVAPQSPTYDFHLTSGSVCRDKGNPTDYPAVDLDGVTRS